MYQRHINEIPLLKTGVKDGVTLTSSGHKGKYILYSVVKHALLLEIE